MQLAKKASPLYAGCEIFKLWDVRNWTINIFGLYKASWPGKDPVVESPCEKKKVFQCLMQI